MGVWACVLTKGRRLDLSGSGSQPGQWRHGCTAGLQEGHSALCPIVSTPQIIAPPQPCERSEPLSPNKQPGANIPCCDQPGRMPDEVVWYLSLCLAYFTYSSIHDATRNQVSFFNGLYVPWCVYTAFFDPFICWWTHRFVLCLGYCK
jgi:hypothetical protein